MLCTAILVDALNIVLPILYFAVVWVYGKAFFADAEHAKRWKSRLLVAMVLTHGFYLIVRTVEFRHPPATTIFEILTLLAFSVAVTYLFIEFRTKTRETATSS